MAHSERARRALAHLPEIDPGLAALALWCTHRDGAGATRTQGDTIIYGDDFTALALHEQVGVLGHHVLHVALRHSWRMGGMAVRLGQRFNAELFNTAADAIVNDTLLAAGHGLPRPCVTVADTLGQPGDVAAWDVERLYHAAQDGKDGAGQGDRPRVQRDLEPDPAGDGADPGAADWRVRTERALAIGRQAGRGIGSVTAPIGDLPDTIVPWARQLRRLVARRLDDHPRPSHRRPARSWVAVQADANVRSGPEPAFQPAMVRQRARPLVAIGLDTSGSVDRDTLRRFGGEIAGIVGRSGADVHLLAFDETVHMSRALAPADLRGVLGAIDLRRDGGTDFTDVLAQAQSLQPSIIVILTDLDGPLGDAPRGPVLWACPTAPRLAPPFGRVLVLT